MLSALPPGLSRRAFLAGSTMILAGAGAFVLTPRRSEHRLARKKLGTLIPRKVGPWSFATNGGVVVPTEEGPVDGYDQVLTRVYEAKNGLPAVMVLIAYGSTQGGSLQLHRPETCYPGQGFTISDFRSIDLPLGAKGTAGGRGFTARRDERIERLIYWTRISDRFPRSTLEEYSAILRSVSSGTVPDGILVRLSTIGSDIALSDRALTDFASALIQSCTAEGRSLLIGEPMAADVARTVEAHNI